MKKKWELGKEILHKVSILSSKNYLFTYIGVKAPVKDWDLISLCNTQDRILFSSEDKVKNWWYTSAQERK